MTSPVVVFDVNETLSDMTPIAEVFTDLGAPGHVAQVWFAALLRDGFAAAAAGSLVPFAELGRHGARSLLREWVDRAGGDLDTAIERVMARFAGLALHPDVAPGVHALAGAGVRLVTLSNGAASVAERLLTGAGIREAFEHVLSVEDAGIWKPAPASYAYAADVCAVAPHDMVMVAVHPWDLHGAALAGLRTVWVDRPDLGRPRQRYPEYFRAPSHVVTGVGGLVDVVSGSAGNG